MGLQNMRPKGVNEDEFSTHQYFVLGLLDIASEAKLQHLTSRTSRNLWVADPGLPAIVKPYALGM